MDLFAVISDPVLVGFLGGGVTAWGLGFIVTHWIRHPVISVRLDKEKLGCYVPVPVYKILPDGKPTYVQMRDISGC